MPRQGEGFWYNPLNGVAIDVNRHEFDIKDDMQQKKLGLKDFDGNVIEPYDDLLSELEPLSPSKDEDKIKILAVAAGLIRVRDWSDFVSIQFMGPTGKLKGTSLKRVLEKLADLIIDYQDKDFSKMQKQQTKAFAKTISVPNDKTLKIDNLSGGSEPSGSIAMSVKEFLREYANSKMFEDLEGGKNKPVRDIPLDSNLCEWATERLAKRGFYKKMDLQNLFEDNQFRAERRRYGDLYEDVMNETQRSQSRQWYHIIDPGVFGIITAYRGDYENQPDKHGRKNQKRQDELIDRMKTLGFGVVKLHGAWREGKDVGREESLLWFPRKDKFEDMEEAGKDLFRLTQDWSEEFEQDGAIYRAVPDPEDPIMLWRHKEEDWNTGKVTIVNDSIKAGKGYKLSDDISENEGKLYINKVKEDLGTGWSELSKGSNKRNFVFESVEDIEDE